MVKPYTFQIEFTNPSNTDNYRITKQSGIVFGETYTDAVKQLTEYYGEDETISIHDVTELETGPIVLPRDIVKNIMNEEYYDHYDK